MKINLNQPLICYPRSVSSVSYTHLKRKQSVKGSTDLEDFDFEDYDEDEPEADETDTSEDEEQGDEE